MEIALKSKYTDWFGEWLRKELYYCYLEARKNKRSTYDEHNFEMFAMENLEFLAQTILAEVYEPGEGISFIVTDPVIREIFAARFRDRIVHHFICDSVMDWWDRRFIYDSYSCRKGKGTLFGVLRAAKMMERASQQYTRPAYVAKFDLSGFFMSLKHELLYERVVWGLDRQMDKNSELYRVNKYLWKKTLFDNPKDKVHKRGNVSLWRKVPREKSLYAQPSGQGIVIGNLSSQLVSNIYLDPFDRYVKYNLGHKYYGRYVDDFFLVIPEEEMEKFLGEDLPLMRDYLLGMGVKMHQNKVYIQPVKRGMTFLGADINPGSIRLAKRTRGNIRQTIHDYAQDKATLEQMTAALGMAKNYDSIKMLMKMFREVGWDYIP